MAVVTDCKNIQLVGIAAHGGYRRRQIRHEILDAPPAAPCTVLHAALPRRGVDPSIAADHEHIQLVRGTREGRDSDTGRRLTARNGPLEQLADVADTLNRLAPGLEALAPTIEMLREAVVTLSSVVNPLSNIADRIPLPRRFDRRPSSAPRTVPSQRIVEHED